MKFVHKLATTLVLLAFCLGPSFGQHYQAVHGSNYAGSLGVMNNPASALSSPLPWDITLLGLQLKNSTNFFYIEKYNPSGKRSSIGGLDPEWRVQTKVEHPVQHEPAQCPHQNIQPVSRFLWHEPAVSFSWRFINL